MLRIQIDEGIVVKLYKKADFEHDREGSVPLAVSHDRLGNNVHEMVAADLSHKEEYLIHVIFASDADDFQEKSQLECLIATMQVKIANSNDDFVCLNKRGQKLIAKHDSQTYPLTLSHQTAAEKGKHMLMASKTNSAARVQA
mmetsp:Transcript_26958/g.33486  ORF Transcript_26958/g.33486 Transcript_26958/m.33486 type:complete len:142 (+) Transcript_26958:329-754(+)